MLLQQHSYGHPLQTAPQPQPLAANGDLVSLCISLHMFYSIIYLNP